jgi:type IX secretion system PorP/SprF family membrane protein
MILKRLLNKTRTGLVRISLALVILLSNLEIFAQQDPMFTHYMFNLSTINPAAVGHTELASVMNINRFQWVGLEGSPKSYLLNADVPIQALSCGAGLNYLFEKIGPERTNNIYADYAYHLNLNENLKLGLGLKAGFRVFSAGLTDLVDPEVSDPQFSSNINGKITPNFGVGAFLYNNSFYVGLSSPKILNHKYVNSTMKGGEHRHYFLIGGYVLPINRYLLFKPSAYFKVVEGAPLSMDISANLLIKNIIWFGVMYRSGDAVGFLTQIQINNQFNFGYTYDITLSKLRLISRGTHEFMLSYKFRTQKENSNIWHF